MTDNLSRRERQIMDIIFTLGRASGPEVQERLPDQPSYSGVRTILRVLERKGHIRHIEEGMRYVYLPVVTREKAKKWATDRVVQTFVEASVKAVAAAFVAAATSTLSSEDIKDLERLIR